MAVGSELGRFFFRQLPTANRQLREPVKANTINLSPRRNARRNRGAALILVLMLVGLSAVLGLAMLSTASLQKQTATNVTDAARAEYLAESGANLALYYLQNPHLAPGGPYTATSANYWRGTGGPTSFDGLSGTVDVAVARFENTADQPNFCAQRGEEPNRWLYEVVSTAAVPTGDGSSSVTRKTTCRVLVETRYEFPYAAVFQNSVTFPAATIVTDLLGTGGSVYALNNASMLTGALIRGPGYRNGGSALPMPLGGWKTLAEAPKKVVLPTSVAGIRSYRTYRYEGSETPDTAGSLPHLTQLKQNLGPTAGNRAGVYYVEGDLDVVDPVRVDGTLIVLGHLNVKSTSLLGHSLHVVPKPGYPALIVQGNVNMASALTGKLKTEGVTWVGQRVVGSTLLTAAPTLDVDGALMVAGTNPLFPSTPLAIPVMSHNPSKANVPDFAEEGRAVVGLKVMKWETAS